VKVTVGASVGVEVRVMVGEEIKFGAFREIKRKLRMTRIKSRSNNKTNNGLRLIMIPPGTNLKSVRETHDTTRKSKKTTKNAGGPA